MWIVFGRFAIIPDLAFMFGKATTMESKSSSVVGFPLAVTLPPRVTAIFRMLGESAIRGSEDVNKVAAAKTAMRVRNT
jgi:hypothetical protein